LNFIYNCSFVLFYDNHIYSLFDKSVYD